MHESEQPQFERDQLLAKIMNCDIGQHRRVTYFLAVLFPLVGFGFTLAGLLLDDSLILEIGFIEILVGAMICVGRLHILKTYELVQVLVERMRTDTRLNVTKDQ